MRKRCFKAIAIMLAISLLLPILLGFKSYRKNEAEHQGIAAHATYKDAILDSKSPILPDFAVELQKEIPVKMEPMQELLLSAEVSCESLMKNPKLENEILEADTLTDLAASKAEIQGLIKLKNESESILASTDISIPKLEKLKAKLGQLLNPGNYSIPEGILSPIKGTWITPDRIVLRWTPEKEWIPEKGFNLFRTVNGSTELIAEGLGSASKIMQLADSQFEFAEYINELYQNAKLDSDKMKKIGVNSLKAFNDLIYGNTNPLAGRLRISGELDFQLEKEQLFRVPGNIAERIPKVDAYTRTDVHFADEINAAPISLEEMNVITHGDSLFAEPSRQSKLTEKEKVIQELLDARKSIMTKAFVDDKFANAIGAGYEDKLAGLNIAQDTPVKYTLVPLVGSNGGITPEQVAAGTAGEGSHSISVMYGVEEPVEIPEEFTGFGAGNCVSLRWKAPESYYSRSIISGYYIERKKKGENTFSRINDTPVAISYSQENGILFESPAFYMDRNVHNGDEMVYRVQALDIFGRLSGFSGELEVKVYKAAPPVQPFLGELVLSTRTNLRTPGEYTQLFKQNQGSTGVALPITDFSNDTDIFVIYRSKVYGNGHFGIPEELARINYSPFTSSMEPVYATTLTGGRFVLKPKGETKADVIYYDNTVEPGYYYKYWAAAVDSWGNESMWSQSKVIGYATDAPPKNPVNVTAMMRHNQKVGERKELPPGFFGRYVRFEPADISGFTGMNNQLNTSVNLDRVGDIDLSGETGNQQGESLGGAGQPASQSSMISGLQSPQEGNQSQMGFSLSDALRHKNQLAPSQVNAELNNLPDSRDVLDIVALSNEDVSQLGTVDFTWNHYLGEGLSEYAVYRAYADGLSKEALRNMSTEEILEAFDWKLKTAKTHINQCTDTVEKRDGRFYVYMICMIPEAAYYEAPGGLGAFVPAGWVRLNWKRPEDPQISYFRVYRAELPYFQDNQNPATLKWSMVADNLKNTVYSEKVDQTIAHYYCYKVTSVSVWGAESENGTVTKYRVPSTVPPQPPVILAPFSKKEVNQVNFLGVANASKYVIYRHKISRIFDEDLQLMYSMAPALYSRMFNLDMYRDTIAQLRDSTSIPRKTLLAAAASFPLSGPIQINTPDTAGFTANMTGRFKTQLLDSTSFRKKLSGVSMTSKLDAFKTIVDKYGILAAVPYSSLDMGMAEGIGWNKVGEVVVPKGQDSTGKKTFYDDTAVFGNTYLYTVQAVNDDNLSSDRPEPVSVFTRKGQPFPPVTNLRWERDDTLFPTITWDAAKDPNLSQKESNQYLINEMNTAGYLVYRSNERDGEYYQVSRLIGTILGAKRPGFQDTHSSIEEENWYKVRVVDTAGYISDFSEPVLVGNKIHEVPEEMFQQTIGNSDAAIPKSLVASLGNPKGIMPSVIIKDEASVSPLPDKSLPIIVPEKDPIKLPEADPVTVPELQQPITVPEIQEPTIPDVQQATVPEAVPVETQLPGFAPARDLMLNGFLIKDVLDDDITEGKGVGKLVIGRFTIPVFVTMPGVELNRIVDGSAALLDNVVLGDTGIHFTELNLKTGADATVNGYISKPSGNVMGDLKRLSIRQSKLTSDGVIDIYGIPDFHYQNLTFSETGKITVNFGNIGNNGMSQFQTNGPIEGVYGADFINLHRGTAESNMGLETIDNKGLEYTYEMVSFDQQGKLAGTFSINEPSKMKAVIPAGLCIKATSSKLVYNEGQVNLSESYIHGLVLTPFETFSDLVTPQPNPTAQGLSINQEMLDAFLGGMAGSASQYEAVLDSSLFYMAQQVQNGTLLIFPDDSVWEETCSSAHFRVSNWDGCGFMIQDTMMTPSRIPLYDSGKLSPEQQEEQADAKLGITPGTVALDLRRDTVYQGASPADTKLPEWMGIVIKYGNVSLPQKYIQNKDGSPITFTLSPGELLYDQNGFCYQNQAYSPEGAPAEFSTELGNYDDVIVRNIVLDLYNNIADMEIEADLGVPLFQRRIKVKLMKDDESGLFICNVAKTEKFDPAGDGKVKLQILGGYMDELGMHVDGTMDLMFGDGGKEFMLMNAQFNDLIIPGDSQMNKLENAEGNGVYGTALFGKPYMVKFHDFPIELRAFSLVSEYIGGAIGVRGDGGASPDEYHGRKYNTTMTLWGGMQLSDNLTMNTSKDADKIVVQDVFNSPKVSYEQCASEMVLNFEDFIEVRGIAVPIRKPGENAAAGEAPEDIVEYDIDQLATKLSAFASLDNPMFTTAGRIGYDRKRERFFFGIASYYKGQIPYAYGEFFNMGGLFAYNMDMQKKLDGTFDVPFAETALDDALRVMTVNKSDNGNYIFAGAFDMTLKYYGYKIGEIKNIALIVEKGPTVEMTGQYFAPTTVKGLATGEPVSPIGEAKIGYYKPQKLFKTSITLLGTDMCGLTLNGVSGFETCPDYWQFYIGYPELMKTSLAGIDTGFGFIIRSSDIDDSYIKARMLFGYDTGDVGISCVFVRGYLTVGGEAEYNKNMEGATRFVVGVYLNGGVEGGVKAFNKRFKVISLMLNANGNLIKEENNDWRLSAEARIRYHVDLWLDDISGTVRWDLSKDL